MIYITPMGATGVGAVSKGDIVEQSGVGASDCSVGDGEVGEGVGELWRQWGVENNNPQASTGGKECFDDVGGDA